MKLWTRKLDNNIIIDLIVRLLNCSLIDVIHVLEHKNVNRNANWFQNAQHDHEEYSRMKSTCITVKGKAKAQN